MSESKYIDLKFCLDINNTQLDGGFFDMAKTAAIEQAKKFAEEQKQIAMKQAQEMMKPYENELELAQGIANEVAATPEEVPVQSGIASILDISAVAAHAISDSSTDESFSMTETPEAVQSGIALINPTIITQEAGDRMPDPPKKMSDKRKRELTQGYTKAEKREFSKEVNTQFKHELEIYNKQVKKIKSEQRAAKAAEAAAAAKAAEAAVAAVTGTTVATDIAAIKIEEKSAEKKGWFSSLWGGENELIPLVYQL